MTSPTPVPGGEREKAWRYLRPKRGGKVHRLERGLRVHRFMYPAQDEWEFVSVANVPPAELCRTCWEEAPMTTPTPTPTPAPAPSGAGDAGAVLGEEARDAVAALLALDGEVGELMESDTVDGWRYVTDRVFAVLAPHVAALVSAAEQRGRNAEAVAIYTAIYERYVRPVDPDLEDYSPDGLVGLLLDTVKDAAEQRGAESVLRRMCELADAPTAPVEMADSLRWAVRAIESERAR